MTVLSYLPNLKRGLRLDFDVLFLHAFSIKMKNGNLQTQALNENNFLPFFVPWFLLVSLLVFLMYFRLFLVFSLPSS